MKMLRCSMRWPAGMAAVWLAVAAAVASVWAGPSNGAASAPAGAERFVVPPPFVAPPIPQSVFVLPKKPAEGRDPFFPKSTRVYGEDQSAKPVKPATPVAELVLKGISGTAEQPLAIINNVTFAVGDELDVPTKAGRMKIRCLEINKDAGTAAVQMGGERRELRLAPLK
jgi:hypothetical protein